MRRAIKWTGISLASLVGVLLVLLLGFYAVGSSKVNRVYHVEPADLTISADSTALARGAHLSRIHGCIDCHGADLSGQVFVDAPPFRVTASNLTPGLGGVGSYYTERDFDRAIRHGVKPSGRGVVVMPSSGYNNMSDEDAAALISYLVALPPVDNELPETEIRVPGRIMSAFLLDPTAEIRTNAARSEAAPPIGPTADYGEYLASITCAHCHGANLRGNPNPPDPDSPPAPDLIAAGHWDLDQFKSTLRTGVTPAGLELDPNFMPFTITSAMEDVELEALYAFLSSLGGEMAAR